MIHWIKNKIAKFLWRGNEWTKAVDDIEKAVIDLRTNKASEVVIKWHFSFLKTPPSNKCKCIITLDN